MKKTITRLGALALIIICTFAFSACGGDDDDDNGGNCTSPISIIGTWRAYYESNDSIRGRVYDQFTFNSNKTGSFIEEVGYGSDTPEGFTWTQSGNIIRITLNYNGGTINITIVKIIDNNTVIINNGWQNYTAYRQ